jgi:cytochrome c oxidase subunit II
VNGLKLSVAEATRNAHDVDVAFFSVLGIAAAIFLVLFVLLVVFAVRYRRGSPARRGQLPRLLRREIEIGWTTATTFLAIFIFWWFVGGSGPPTRAAPGQLEIHVVARQWMWKVQHPDGAREIDALHLPVDTAVRLVMTSQDVIHSFYVPAFRLKEDVLPVRDTVLSFTTAKTGTFHLLCAEFCGTEHSRMKGAIMVLSQRDYAAWLRSQPHGDSLVREGEALYAKSGCGGCHAGTSHVPAPKLSGLYGSTVILEDGRRVQADDAYLKTAILRPRDNPVAGYEPMMPSYGALFGPAELDAIIAYLKTLSTGQGEP